MPDDLLRLRPADAATILSGSSGEVVPANSFFDEAMVASLHDPAIFGGGGTDRFGHVPLPLPVVHPWLRRVVAQCLGLAVHALDAVLALRAGWRPDDGAFEPDNGNPFEVATGPRAVQARLAEVDPPPDLAAWFAAVGRRPADLVLTVLPVLPPRFRHPPGGSIDRLHAHVFASRSLLARLLELRAPDAMIDYTLSKLQAAVDRLFDNRRHPDPLVDDRGSALPALADLLDATADPRELRLLLRGCAFDTA